MAPPAGRWASLFEEVERPALQPLSAGLFPVFEEALRSVHRDGYVGVQTRLLLGPPEYIGRQVWVRHETRLLRIYNQRREQIALHTGAEPGQFTTDLAHLHSRQRHLIERGADHLLDRCRLVGPLTGTWAEAMPQARGLQGLRVMLAPLATGRKTSRRRTGKSRPCRHAPRRLAAARSQA